MFSRFFKPEHAPYLATGVAVSTSAFLGAVVQASIADERRADQKERMYKDQGKQTERHLVTEYTPIHIRHFTEVSVVESPSIKP